MDPRTSERSKPLGQLSGLDANLANHVNLECFDSEVVCLLSWKTPKSPCPLPFPLSLLLDKFCATAPRARAPPSRFLTRSSTASTTVSSRRLLEEAEEEAEGLVEEYAAALADPENPAQNTAAEEAQVAGLKAVVHERPEGRRAVKPLATSPRTM